MKITIGKIPEICVKCPFVPLIKAIGGYNDSEIGKIMPFYYNYT